MGTGRVVMGRVVMGLVVVMGRVVMGLVVVMGRVVMGLVVGQPEEWVMGWVVVADVWEE